MAPQDPECADKCGDWKGTNVCNCPRSKFVAIQAKQIEIDLLDALSVVARIVNKTRLYHYAAEIQFHCEQCGSTADFTYEMYDGGKRSRVGKYHSGRQSKKYNCRVSYNFVDNVFDEMDTGGKWYHLNWVSSRRSWAREFYDKVI